MNALGFIIVAGGIVVGYEALKSLHGLGTANAAAAPSDAGSGVAAAQLAAQNAAQGGGDVTTLWRQQTAQLGAKPGQPSTWGTKYSGEQIFAALRQVGATADEASVMTQLALRESEGGYSQAVASLPQDPYYGIWGGLWQDIPPTGNNIGVHPGATLAQQAAANLRLFRQNHGSDWVQPGYPLPQPGPYE